MSAAPSPWNGKRTDRLLLRVDEIMAAKIRRRAAAEHRTITLEVVHLLDLALKSEKRREQEEGQRR